MRPYLICRSVFAPLERKTRTFPSERANSLLSFGTASSETMHEHPWLPWSHLAWTAWSTRSTHSDMRTGKQSLLYTLLLFMKFYSPNLCWLSFVIEWRSSVQMKQVWWPEEVTTTPTETTIEWTTMSPPPTVPTLTLHYSIPTMYALSANCYVISRCFFIPPTCLLPSLFLLFLAPARGWHTSYFVSGSRA